MSAVALLAELEAADIRLCRDGDDLIAEIRPGASLAPFRERILAHKPMILSILADEVQVAAPELEWRHVYQGPVESTVPPPDWDGALCQECRWAKLCHVLGPRGQDLPGWSCTAWPSSATLTNE
jgi:hypothetical protein